MPHKTRVAVLISGHGSNLQALIDASHAHDFPAEIVLVISNKSDAYGLTRAKAAGIPAIVIRHQDFPAREAFDAHIHEALCAHEVRVVCLAGFMRLLSPEFVAKWHGKMLNIHPSLLPDFKGVDSIRQALNAGVRTTGVTVHYVSEEMDAGEIILQKPVDILPGDTLESLSERIHALEHVLYPQALKLHIHLQSENASAGLLPY